MGRGARHSKNAGGMGSGAQTYHERAAQGHGTVMQRLGNVRRCIKRKPDCAVASFICTVSGS